MAARGSRPNANRVPRPGAGAGREAEAVVDRAPAGGHHAAARPSRVRAAPPALAHGLVASRSMPTDVGPTTALAATPMFTPYVGAGVGVMFIMM